MNDRQIESRLRTIFGSVLDVPGEQIDNRFSPETCARWDSLATIHIVNGIEEEFGIELEFQDQLEMLSFAAAKAIVSRHALGGAGEDQ